MSSNTASITATGIPLPLPCLSLSSTSMHLKGVRVEGLAFSV